MNQPYNLTLLDLSQHGGRTCIGFVTMIISGLIFLSLVVHKNRKYFTCLIVLSFADIVEGSANFTAGAFRLYFYATYQYTNLVPPFSCFRYLHPILFQAGHQFMALTLLFLAVDRIIAIGIPMWYHRNVKEKHHYFVIGYMTFHVSCIVTFEMVMSYCQDQSVLVGRGCSSQLTAGATYEYTTQLIVVACAQLTALTYVVACVLLLIKSRTVDNNNTQSVPEQAKKRQKRLTKVMVAMLLATICLWVFPTAVHVLTWWSAYTKSLMSGTFGTVFGYYHNWGIASHSFFDSMILIAASKDVRVAIRMTLRLKMGPNRVGTTSNANTAEKTTNERNVALKPIFAD